MVRRVKRGAEAAAAAFEALALFLLLLVLLPCGCTSSPWKREPFQPAAVREGTGSIAEGIFFYRERRVVDGQRQALEFAHPVDITHEELALVLGALRYEHGRSVLRGNVRAVFEPGEVDIVAPRMAAALQEIGADERLRFLVVRNRVTDLFTGPEGVSGVVFRPGDRRLNLAFDDINSGINIGDQGRPEDVIFPDDPTELRDGSPLVPFAGSTLHRSPQGGPDFPRWLEVDVDGIRARIADARRERGSGQPAASSAPLPPPRAGDGGKTGEEAIDDTLYRDVKRRLGILKRLRDDGEISAEEFARRKEELLEELLDAEAPAGTKT